ncbi:alginate lyase family protein [Arcticibacter tournemirensis]|uniref:Alginate lyase domain-containing protein n=1 Tax=Arcticibacter tournemirensis TaxID=699437 RepID=A0A4Q0M784_9SPHI|nr:alginate lyase family protein [Arcticibacter tournemirensis]RXF68629.1 hypothetical protein EKH83_14970 [Arcticibacter tournemirensis]
MKYFLLTISLLAASSALGYEHPGGMHTREQIEFVKRQVEQGREPWLSAFRQLKEKADVSLTREHHAVSDFHIPGFYLDKKGHQESAMVLWVDGFNAYSCALAWTLTGKKEYADKAIYFLDAWASVNKRYSEADGPLVMTYSGASLVMAGELMRSYRPWKKQNREMFRHWVTSVYQDACRSIRSRKNNWGDWGTYGAMLADYFLDDSADMEFNIRQLKESLPQKIASDGHLIEEVKREANGIWYTYFSLTPVTGSFWIAFNGTHENLFASPEGLTVKKAVDYLLYYNQHIEEWPWYQVPRQGKPNSSNTFWPANLIEAMSEVYKDGKYTDYVSPFRPLVYESHHFVWTFPTLMTVKTDGYK